jgi:prepilin-type N-terminal cleavage/methylation domain-containing protein
MKKNLLQKGFTLIELLVVVAIIALLASTILGSLGSARQKAKSSKIVSELSSLRAQMELYASDHGGDYGSSVQCSGGAFNDATTNGAKTLVSGIDKDTGGQGANVYCNSNGISWAVAALTPASGVWCVDSGGRSIQSTAATDDLAVVTNGGIVECLH